MAAIRFQVHDIPAVLYGESSDRVWLFVHGKCGYKEEAEAFAEGTCSRGAQVPDIGLPEHGERKTVAGFDPWHVVPGLREVMAVLRQRWAYVSLRANSIGGVVFHAGLSGYPTGVGVVSFAGTGYRAPGNGIAVYGSKWRLLRKRR